MSSLSVTLPREQWQTVLQILAQQPWHVANPIIAELQRQAAASEAQPAPRAVEGD